MDTWEVVIVGGGPAGLSAALVLGRARRKVLVIDEGRPRNAASRAAHGFLTRDGIAPLELLRLGREQLQRYETVSWLADRVERAAPAFRLDTKGGKRLACRKLIIATGLVDQLPDIPGLAELYGTRVFHCPYCDGFEAKDQALVVYGSGDRHGGGFALELLQWSRNVTLCLGGGELSAGFRERLARYEVTVRDERIARLTAERVELEGGSSLPYGAFFFASVPRQGSDLAAQLGCTEVDRYGQTNVPGVYVVGDASRDVLQISVAVGEGAQAAITANTALLEDDYP
jgi:thioredoxin reductase